MANMDSDPRHLPIPEGDHEINPGPMNIQFDPSDIRSKRKQSLSLFMLFAHLFAMK
ncbi:hypothetical protein FD755_025057 [Muntiacus reevesi]|uniref:Uncharacterized protein n=1 Tax=Muntiacus reevesi TaxID=9886 RepID=A0A5N3UQS9_MUNRE|nr:hypothetical protein FD755_025057 [Muntiacus reevesi]